MADRIMVLSANPGRIRTIVENPLPRPRDYRSPAFLGLVDRLHEIITGQEMPDAAVAAKAAPSNTMDPLPAAVPGEIVGLLEYLDARGGREDVFQIAGNTNHEFGRMITIVKAAEMLNLVDTPKRMVILDVEGSRFLKAVGEERKVIWRKQLLELRLFREIRDLMEKSPDHTVERDFILEVFAMRMPQENYERLFHTFVQWARFGDLFAYDKDKEMLFPQ